MLRTYCGCSGEHRLTTNEKRIWRTVLPFTDNNTESSDSYFWPLKQHLFVYREARRHGNQSKHSPLASYYEDKSSLSSLPTGQDGAAETKLERNLPAGWVVKTTGSIAERLRARSGYFQWGELLQVLPKHLVYCDSVWLVRRHDGRQPRHLVPYASGNLHFMMSF